MLLVRLLVFSLTSVSNNGTVTTVLGKLVK